ncbi:cysteine desulfurase family protein [Halalkalibacter urbisdiaboli]|uniref:cysteine desulfurase family protein n=1 Tax=Halalkalibacter urbisdiaboli TaxID=1960589 RepID=UPI000B4354E0|nr:aminotransferase class V-fold PLP-dependent enzyme [Halalkalibacter urbisdiaboli]
MLYLDNSATTQILPAVKEAMLPYLLEEFGNPSSKYYSLAEKASKAVKEAREQVSRLIGCNADEVIFTSGATESNNMIIKGIVDFYGDSNKHIITSKTEHPSVLETCRYLEQKGFRVTYLDVDRYGRIDLVQLANILETPPLLVSIMWGNNEIGSLNQIKEISKLCVEKDVFFHTDATQVIGKVPVDLNQEGFEGVQFLSCSAHKFHGPKGIGVAVIKKDELGLRQKITPLLHGGGQEYDYRSGTLPVHNIVGMGKAAELAFFNLYNNVEKLKTLESYLQDILLDKFGEVIQFNHDSTDKIPGILSVQFQGVNNETLIKTLSPIVAVSTGSACSSTKPSHVLQAIGLSMEEIRSTIRFSLSHLIDKTDLDIFDRL